MTKNAPPPARPVTEREAQMFAQGPATRDRFLAAIAERVSPDRMQAVFLFPPIRSGAVETGVAVLAVDPLPPPPAAVLDDTGSLFEVLESAEPTATVVTDDGDAEGAREATDVVTEGAAEAVTEAATDDVADETIDTTDGHHDADDERSDAPLEGADARSPRPLVLTARYRHTLKGPDRGKWFVEVHEQADAPLATVEMVVAGVTQRHDDAVAPEHLDAEAVRAAISAGSWTTATR